MANYTYKTDWHGPNKFESTWDEEDLELLAEDAAQDFHSNHDGWESKWPRPFEIFNEQGQSLGKFEVDIQMEPSFVASQLSEGK